MLGGEGGNKVVVLLVDGIEVRSTKVAVNDCSTSYASQMKRALESHRVSCGLRWISTSLVCGDFAFACMTEKVYLRLWAEMEKEKKPLPRTELFNVEPQIEMIGFIVERKSTDDIVRTIRASDGHYRKQKEKMLESCKGGWLPPVYVVEENTDRVRDVYCSTAGRFDDKISLSEVHEMRLRAQGDSLAEGLLILQSSSIMETVSKIAACACPLNDRLQRDHEGKEFPTFKQWTRGMLDEGKALRGGRPSRSVGEKGCVVHMTANPPLHEKFSTLLLRLGVLGVELSRSSRTLPSVPWALGIFSVGRKLGVIADGKSWGRQCESLGFGLATAGSTGSDESGKKLVGSGISILARSLANANILVILDPPKRDLRQRTLALSLHMHLLASPHGYAPISVFEYESVDGKESVMQAAKLIGALSKAVGCEEVPPPPSSVLLPPTLQGQPARSTEKKVDLSLREIEPPPNVLGAAKVQGGGKKRRLKEEDDDEVYVFDQDVEILE